MHQVAQAGCWATAEGDACPVPQLTGNRDLDQTILHRRNSTMAERLPMYVRSQRMRRTRVCAD